MLCPGYSERRIAISLDAIRKRILAERNSEKTQKVAGANKRSIIFFVTSYMSSSSEKAEIKKVEELMIKEMPGIIVLFGVTFLSIVSV